MELSFLFTNQTLLVSYRDLKGTGYEVVQITVLDSNGQNPKVFTSAKYTQTNQGVVIGTTLLIVGLMMAAFAFAVPIIRGRLGKSKKQVDINITP